MQTTVFRDMVGLKKGLQDVTIEALNDTISECYQELKKIIDEDVYKKAKHECSNHFYERTYDMLNAFVINWATKRGLGISATTTIDFDESKISHNIGKFTSQHANSKEELDGTTFFGILNNDVKQGSHGYAYVEREPFFDDWLEWIKKNYDKIYSKNLAKHKIISYRKSKGL